MARKPLADCIDQFKTAQQHFADHMTKGDQTHGAIAGAMMNTVEALEGILVEFNRTRRELDDLQSEIERLKRQQP